MAHQAQSLPFMTAMKASKPRLPRTGLAVHSNSFPQGETRQCILILIGNDFFDLSNIVGAGGNLTVQQVDEPSTRKGDPLFMQHLDDAWQRADQGTRDGLSQCVHTDGSGHVVRIDAIKDFPQLENFVRSFADGKTYIGVCALGGSPGNANDNNQSSAGKGNKDIQVTYNDGDASPPS